MTALFAMTEILEHSDELSLAKSGIPCDWFLNAGVAELVDAPDLGSGGAICAGSSPVPGTLDSSSDVDGETTADERGWTQI